MPGMTGSLIGLGSELVDKYNVQCFDSIFLQHALPRHPCRRMFKLHDISELLDKALETL